MKTSAAKIMLTVLALLCLNTGQTAVAEDVDTLNDLLRFFLAHADKKSAHDSFWAKELIYTSSAGERFGKAEIMSGFDDVDVSDSGEQGQPEIEYSGADIEVRVYGDSAVVAFKLVGTPADGSAVLYYFNTGTFLRRNGDWKAIAWQATKIP